MQPTHVYMDVPILLAMSRKSTGSKVNLIARGICFNDPSHLYVGFFQHMVNQEMPGWKVDSFSVNFYQNSEGFMEHDKDSCNRQK